MPIIVDERMQIIDGILRFEIAKELGLPELNAVVVSDATEAKLLQLELSLNRLAEDGDWDSERLKSKFEQLIGSKEDSNQGGGLRYSNVATNAAMFLGCLMRR